MTNTEFLKAYDLLPEGCHVLCALSGGRDSVYLLYRLLEWREQGRLRVSAAHFNHRLRGEESQRDEVFVRGLCHDLNVPLYTGEADVSAYAREQGVGVEEAARSLRYAFLERTQQEIGADRIATAHHAEDQAETMLLNLVRGAGTKGLGGIPPKRGAIVRPLLLTTRREIDEYLNRKGCTYVEDSTNSQDICTRNILRHRVMPVLQELNPAFAEHAARSSLLLRADDAYLQSQLPVTDGDGVDCRLLLELPYPLASRMVRSLWGGHLSSAHVGQILEFARGDGLGYLHVPGAVIRRDGGRLWRNTPELELPDVPITGEQGSVRRGNQEFTWEIGEFHDEIHNSFNTFYLKYETIHGDLTITSRRDGDRIRFSGKSHTTRLKQLFQQEKLTQPQRAAVPILRDDHGIAAVFGFGMAQRCVPEIGEKIICIKYKKYRENGE